MIQVPQDEMLAHIPVPRCRSPILPVPGRREVNREALAGVVQPYRKRGWPDTVRNASAQENPMKAIVYDKYGSPDVLEIQDIDKPEGKGDEVLV